MDVVTYANQVNHWVHECVGWDVSHGAFWTAWSGQAVPADVPHDRANVLVLKAKVMHGRTLNRLRGTTQPAPAILQLMPDMIDSIQMLYVHAFFAWVAYVMCTHLESATEKAKREAIILTNGTVALTFEYLQPFLAQADWLNTFTRMHNVERLIMDPYNPSTDNILARLTLLAKPRSFPAESRTISRSRSRTRTGDRHHGAPRGGRPPLGKAPRGGRRK